MIVPTAVLFDFGNTLFGHASGPAVLIEESAKLDAVVKAEEAEQLWAEIDAAAMEADEVALGRDLSRDVWGERWPQIYSIADGVVAGLGSALDRSWHDPWAWVPYADTAWVLRALHEAAVPVGVLSNTGWSVNTAFEVRGYDRWVHAFTLSCDVGVAKPDPAIFVLACEAIGVEPSQTLMVGDDAVADHGALAAGLADLLLVDPATPPGEPHGLDQVFQRLAMGTSKRT